jgi:hypothetical protein
LRDFVGHATGASGVYAIGYFESARHAEIFLTVAEK